MVYQISEMILIQQICLVGSKLHHPLALHAILVQGCNMQHIISFYQNLENTFEQWTNPSLFRVFIYIRAYTSQLFSDQHKPI